MLILCKLFKQQKKGTRTLSSIVQWIGRDERNRRNERDRSRDARDGRDERDRRDVFPEKRWNPGFYFQVSQEEFEEMVPRLIRHPQMAVRLRICDSL